MRKFRTSPRAHPARAGWAPRGFLIWAAAILGAVVLYRFRGELAGIGAAVAGADLSWLAVALAALAAWCLAWSALLVGCRQVAGVRGRWGDVLTLLPVSTLSVALNLVTKSGGLAGLASWLREGRRRGEPLGAVTAAYLLAAALAEVAFIVTLIAALVLIAVDGALTRAEVLASVVFLPYAAVRLGLLVVAGRSRAQLRRLWAVPGRAKARLLRRPAQGADTTTADELSDAVQLAARNPRQLLAPLTAAVAVDLFGVMMLWACLAAVTGRSQPATALVAYGVSSLFGVVGFLPGGLGFVEVGAITLLTGAGVAAPTAAAATLLYRVYDLYLPGALGGVGGLWLRHRR